MLGKIIASNEHVRIYSTADTCVSDGYIRNVWTRYADNKPTFKKKLKLYMGKHEQEYARCYEIRCYIDFKEDLI